MLVRTLADALDADLLARPVHARPHARRHPRHERHRRGRRAARSASSSSKGPIFAQHRPGRRDQPRHAEDAERAARGDAGALGHRRQARPTRSTSRSSCSRRRTRSRWRAPTRCPRRSSIASSSSSTCRSRAREELHDDPRPHDRRRPAERAGRCSTARAPPRDAASSCGRCRSRGTCRTTPCACSRRRTRRSPTRRDHAKRFVRYGSSPRGAQAFLLGAKIRALFDGRFAASHRRRPRRGARRRSATACS